MNILTIGLRENVIELVNSLNIATRNNILHIYDKDQALEAIKDIHEFWDWIILQGHDNPIHWKSILCAANANASNTPITVLSSHIDGTRLRTPVCSMHKDTNDDSKLVVSRCAMQNLLQQEEVTHSTIEHNSIENSRTPSPTPIVFEYHAPCR